MGYPPSPRSSGIIALEENREVIYGTQWLTGKILSRKELDPSRRSGFRRRAHTPAKRLKLRAGHRLPRTPIAPYTAFALAGFYSPDREPQGRGSHWGVIALRALGKIVIRPVCSRFL